MAMRYGGLTVPLPSLPAREGRLSPWEEIPDFFSQGAEEPRNRRESSENREEATVGFEPTNNGFAIHRLSRLATSPVVLRNLEKDS